MSLPRCSVPVGRSSTQMQHSAGIYPNVSLAVNTKAGTIYSPSQRIRVNAEIVMTEFIHGVSEFENVENLAGFEDLGSTCTRAARLAGLTRGRQPSTVWLQRRPGNFSWPRFLEFDAG